MALTESATNAPLAELPCTVLRGVGANLAKKLANLAIFSLQDLLFHLPLRYQDRTRVTPLSDVQIGEYAVIEGNVVTTEVRRVKRLSLLCRLRDASGEITLRFFHFTRQQKEALQPGVRLRCFGEVRYGVKGREMVHPEYRRVSHEKIISVEEHLTPIYPSTEGISQHTWRQLSAQALQYLSQGHALQELLPQAVLERFALMPINSAVQFAHRPPPYADTKQLEMGTHPAQQRLAFEELLVHHISLLRLRMTLQQFSAPVLTASKALLRQFYQQLPFTLTQAQQRVISEIEQDLQQQKPMLRLVQGDVGSGKTIVAAAAALHAVASGFQVALMAPTEILAEQHFHHFQRWCDDLKVSVVCLLGKVKGKVREAVLADIAATKANIVIGTHAIFQENVRFANLGLIIIDEQHRFGVDQRLALRDKGRQGEFCPHQLIMTATPIPRTLAMLLYADLDCSTIDELPPGRTPIRTVVIPNSRRHDVMERVHWACQNKTQVYWVCTLIEESEILECQAAEMTWQTLKESLPNNVVGLIHGRQKAAEKEAIMQAFKRGEIDLLVATTVVEVGVDVPNATLMVIENAERFGLSQLHQLRGRVGRGAATSYCVLLYQSPLSAQARARLQVMRETTDGFKIAQQDLELRGMGEVLGTKQTGMMRFRIADLQRDRELLYEVSKAAELLTKEFPESIDDLIQRWLGQSERFAVV